MVKRLRSGADWHTMEQPDEPEMKRRKNELRKGVNSTTTSNLKKPDIKTDRDESETTEGCAQQIDRIETARKQFAPLSAEWKQKIQRARIDPAFEITTPYLTIRHNDIKALLDILGVDGIETADVPERLVEAYVRMICDYRNASSDKPKCAMLSSDMMELYNPQNKKAPEYTSTLR